MIVGDGLATSGAVAKNLPTLTWDSIRLPVVDFILKILKVPCKNSTYHGLLAVFRIYPFDNFHGRKASFTLVAKTINHPTYVANDSLGNWWSTHQVKRHLFITKYLWCHLLSHLSNFNVWSISPLILLFHCIIDPSIRTLELPHLRLSLNQRSFEFKTKDYKLDILSSNN